MMMEMLLQGGDLHSATDLALIGAIPSNVRWNWVGWYHLSNTHRVIKNDLVEEHFFKTIDSNDQIYFRVVYSDLDHSVPMITNAIRISYYNGTYTVYNYILKTINSIIDFNEYKLILNDIMSSKDIQTTKMLDFVNTYMKDINLTN